MYFPVSLQHLRRLTRRAFTLIEMVIVIALIATVMGITLYNMNDLFMDAKEDAERIKVTNSLPGALLRFNTHMGRYPTTEEGLQALVRAPQGGDDRWRGPYVKDESALIDAWGNPYQYKFPGTQNPRGFDLWSLGPNKEAGPIIGNWSNAKP